MDGFKSLLQSLAQVNPEQLTYTLIQWMVILTVVFSINIIRYRGRHGAQFSANLLTTIGILGTFIGITIGLLNFNTHDIDGSIPNLLEGLKMAFITSIAGMALAILLRLLSEVFKLLPQKGNKKTVASEIAPVDILNAIQAQHKILNKICEEIRYGNESASRSNDSMVANLNKFSIDLQDEFKTTGKTLAAVQATLEKTHTAIAGEDEFSLKMQMANTSSLMQQEFSNISAALNGSKDSINSAVASLCDDLKTTTNRITEKMATCANQIRDDLNGQFNTANTTTHAIRDVMEKTHHALAGDDEKSVTALTRLTHDLIYQGFANTQEALNGSENSTNNNLTALRSDLKEMGGQVAQEFRIFADKVSEIGTKQFIQALEQAIRDFNSKLTEQFGDNFKRLDESVQKLLEWQDRYKDQLADMDAQFKRTVQGIQTTETTLGQIAGYSSAIPEHMNHLEAIIRTSDAQLQDMEKHLEAFAEVKDKAVGAMPEIRARVDEVMDSMRESVKKASEHYEIMLDDSKELVTSFNTSWKDLHKGFTDDTGAAVKAIGKAASDASQSLTEGTRSIKENLDQAGNHISKGAEQLGTSIQNNLKQVFDNLSQEISRSSGDLKTNIISASNQLNQLINNLIGRLDQDMQEELQKALQIMANQLGSISDKFVEDYRELTKGMEAAINRHKELVHEH